MIPFLDLKAQYKSIAPELEAAVLEVLRRGDYVMGESVSQFETDFAAFCGAREAVAVNTGTSALHLALLAVGVGPGDEVVTVSSTFVATVAAILYTGATPVFVDIDPVTWTLDPELVEQALTPRTKAILPVHLHGRMADMERIGAIARRHGLRLIEDAAQAHGAVRDGRPAGTFGDIGCFSFYPGKNLGACGEGGGIITNNPDFAACIRSLRDWGQAGKYNHVQHGFNYRLDTLQAAALAVKLRRLAEWTAARQRVAALYDQLLEDSAVGRPAPAGRDHAYHVYAVRVLDRDQVQAELKEAGVATNIHYPRPVHLQPAYARLGYGPGQLPVSEALARETLSLPIYPELTVEQATKVAAALRRCLEFARRLRRIASAASKQATGRAEQVASGVGTLSGFKKASEVFAGKRVLVTGGAGFVGSHIIDLLAESGCGEIIAIDNMVRGRPQNLARAMTHGNVRLIEGDICDRELMSSLVADTDTVFHQAALRITQCAAEPRAAMKVMVNATFDLLELCVANRVRKVVMASSASVYGMADEFPITEKCPPYANRTIYGAAKMFAEGLLRSFNDMKSLDYISLRYFNVYGTRMDIHGRYTEVMIRWMEQLASGLPPIVFGDGLQTMDMINVKDVARANVLAAVSSASDVVLNIGSGAETSLLEVARLLAEAMGRANVATVHEEERAVNPVPRRLADISAARRLIGFEPTVPLKSGIAELVDWWLRERAADAASQAAE